MKYTSRIEKVQSQIDKGELQNAADDLETLCLELKSEGEWKLLKEQARRLVDLAEELDDSARLEAVTLALRCQSFALSGLVQGEVEQEAHLTALEDCHRQARELPLEPSILCFAQTSVCLAEAYESVGREDDASMLLAKDMLLAPKLSREVEEKAREGLFYYAQFVIRAKLAQLNGEDPAMQVLAKRSLVRAIDALTESELVNSPREHAELSTELIELMSSSSSEDDENPAEAETGQAPVVFGFFLVAIILGMILVSR